MQRERKRKTKGYLLIVLLVFSLFSTYVVLGAVPINDNMNFTNPDDTNNMYAQLGDYIVITNHTDADGWEDIDRVLLNFTQGAVLRASFLWDNTTNAFSLIFGNWDVNATLSSSTRAGTNTNLTWAVTPQYDATEEANVDVDLSVFDSIGGSDTDTYLNQFDVVVNILVMNFTSNHDDDRGNLGQELWFSGNNYFADDPGSAVPTTIRPADSEYAAISIYNSSNANLGSDTNIVNGSFAVRIYGENSVGLETYNPHIDLVDTNYTDGEEPPTDTFIADRIVVYWEQHNVSRAPAGGWIEGRYRAVLEYDQHPLDQGEPDFIWAANGTEAGIQAAVDTLLADNGGTVLVPAGDWTFNISSAGNAFNNKRYGVTFDMSKNISIIGMGVGTTILRMPPGNFPTTGSFMFTVGGHANGGRFRISGFSMVGFADDEDKRYKAIGVYGMTDFRIDNIKFINFTSAAIQTSRNFKQAFEHRGVISNIETQAPYKIQGTHQWSYGIIITGTGNNWINDTDTWLRGQYVNDTVYIEDSWFNASRHGTSSNAGGYFVERFSNHTYAIGWNFGMSDIHGTSGAAPLTGGIGAELYENSYTGWFFGSWAGLGFNLRGGMAIFTNNSLIDCNYAVGLLDDATNPKCNVSDSWIWGNNMINISAPDPGDLIWNFSGEVLGETFWLEEKENYVRYEYPAPMAGIYDQLNSSLNPLVWDAGSSWFELNHTEAAPSIVTIGGLTGYEETYGITALIMNITAQEYRYGLGVAINVVPAASIAEVNLIANATIAKINNRDW